jgi:hypothetical protein
MNEKLLSHLNVTKSNLYEDEKELREADLENFDNVI